jgi:hypothetical protein
MTTEFETIRQENEKLNQTITELNNKFEKQHSDPGENIQVSYFLLFISI